MTLQTHALAARWIVPIVGEPINRGWIRLRGEEIVEIGEGECPGDADDLGDVAILPGLVNAHTHLEFSDCLTPIGGPGIPLHDWIGQVIAARGANDERKKQFAIRQGLRESLLAGVRLIGEITTPPFEYPMESVPELVAFAEVLGLKSERAAERLMAATQQNEQDRRSAWSAHAPYSTSPETIEACVQHAKQTNRPIAMHVAESCDERELLTVGTGPFAETLQRFGAWEDGIFPWGQQSFAKLIQQLANAPRGLIVHANFLDQEEMGLIASHSHLSVVHCPRTHAFFQHAINPLNDLVATGVNVALGTDSRASNPDLNLWHEVQHLLRHAQGIPPKDILRMATMNGANALGRTGLGRLQVGGTPGLKIIPTAARNLSELYESFAG